MSRRVGSRARTAQDQQVHGGLAPLMQGAERGRWQLLGYHMLEKGGTSARAVDGSMCVASLHGASRAEADSARLVRLLKTPRTC